MTHVDTLVPAGTAGRPRPPGFLLTPFGWAAEPLAAMAAAEPSLLPDLFTISQARMHLIALALAHLDTQVPPDIGLFARRSSRKVLDRVLGHAPAGIERALHRLPVAVLNRQNYRRLVNLLDDPESAKVLHHAAKISDSTIRVLYEMPGPLRRPLTAAVPGWSDKLDGLADGLRFLVSRGVAPSFDEIVADLLSVTQYGQLAAKFGDWVDGLPLPESMPPPIVGPARRLDRSGDVCALAKRWKNCLADYVPAIDAGECAVYFWENTEMPAVCLVRRHGRLGWFLDESKGPRNADLEPGPLEIVAATFAEIGIQTSRVISGIENLTFCRAWQRPRYT
jgi:hypothetical protein